MTEAAMRAEFIGKTIDGHFHHGGLWTVAFFADGGMDHYQDRRRRMAGHWFFRGVVFCSVPEPAFRGDSKIGCWSIVKASANCYYYYRVAAGEDEPTDTVSRDSRWYARGWRQAEASTCDEKPTV